MIHSLPFTVTDTELVATDVPEPNTDEWDSGTAYVIDDEVEVLGTVHRRYRAVAGSTNEYPPDDTANDYWVEIARTNRWKPFDQHISDQMTQVDTAYYDLTFSTKTPQVVACFNVDADSVRLQVTDTEETEVYDETVEMVDNSVVNDFWEYFFSPIIKKDVAIFSEIPPHYGASLTITFTTASGQNVGVGQIVVGDKFPLGRTQYGSSVGIRDYSRKEQNAFGQFDITERDYSDEIDFSIQFYTKSAGGIKKRLSESRATPTLWVGHSDNDYSLATYGFFENFELTLSTVHFSDATITIIGLV